MGLRENILTESVRDLPLRRVVVVDEQQTVRQVIAAMRRSELGAAITLDASGKPAGMFNEKLLISLLTKNPAGLDEPVSKYLTRNIVCVSRNDSIATLILTMRRQNLRWVVVVDEKGRPVNLSGLRGVMEYVVEHFPRRVFVQPLQSKLAIDEREGA